ncbi:tetratricopeptide repeat protein 21B isoform X2 [Aplysia californica]|uniref:Tetratricopeptide repeat protein 21B isoform X2 n=1 Tax=Aplysia californica TaxID=6500 RepID=A0ABM1A2U8_APLCA|nr:tetratricopeptide repeat protein 21B isoform X2 [Aplysia californica]
MAEADPVTVAKINYYCQTGYYGHMESAASEGLQRYGNDPVLKFFVAFAKVLQNRVQEGMRELDMLKDKRDVNLCSTMALMFAHKKSGSTDRDAIQELDMKLKEERKQAGELGLYFAGLFLFNSGKHDKAREYIDRMLKMAPQNADGLTLKGWIELLSGREAKKAIKFFEEALADGSRNVSALFGKAKYFELRHNYSGALELINQVVVGQTNFLPAFVEKMKLQLALQDWDQTLEAAQRALDMDIHCLEAMEYQIVHTLCREGNYTEAASKIADVVTAMDRQETQSSQLYVHMAQVFSKLCGRNSLVLQQTHVLVERAVSLDHHSADIVNEMGCQLMMQGKVKEAMKCHRSAMQMDESSVSALTGIISCQLLLGHVDEAAQQLEFLNEIQQNIGRSAELAYLSAVLAKKKGRGPEKSMELLNEAIELHFAGLKGLPLGIEYFCKLNPDFLLQVIKDYLQFGPQVPVTSGQPISPVLKRCHQVLDPLTRAVPGLMEGLFLIAKVKFLAGDVNAAQSTLQHCLDQDATFSDAHILMAQIHLSQNNFKLANQSLEVGLSYNFQVRDHPLYHLILARILKKQGDSAEAVKTLQMAMALPGVKKIGSRSESGKKSRVEQISVNDRVSVFLELAEAHRQQNEQHEAAKVMQDAINEFQGTPEEVRILIANAELSLARGDIEMALGMLRNITADQPYFVEAREKMADIYLNHRKDKRLYASCYRELNDKHPSTHTCLLLGDAYMSVQEPEKAIEVYESALKKNPKDAALATKIGQALVKTHNYGKAINYYEASLKSGGQASLRYDLAELLLKLRQYDKAEKVLRQALEQDGQDLETLMEHTRYLLLLSQVYSRVDKLEDSQNTLQRAREMQAKVLKRVQVEQPDAVHDQKELAAKICSQLAEHATNQRDTETAIKFYKDALVYSENDSKRMLDLAGLYLMTEDLDGCQHQLMTLLKNDSDNDNATIMLADLMFRRNEYDSAMYHFQQLLQSKPDNYEALARLVDLMRRAGKLEEVPKFLETAQNASSRAPVEAGFCYCKGLYEWYSGNPTEALKHFNKARKDSDWGSNAIYNMIEICLNPDNETIGGEVFDTVEGEGGRMSSDKEKQDSELMAVRTAEKLIREAKPKPGDVRHTVLENMALIASKQKQNIERALNNFMEICSNEREHVGALYGIAAAYMVLKQTPRARNTLKRVAKSPWTIQDGEDLEKSWLLLADIYVQSGKYDMAQELLKRVLQYNKSCCKAYEYMGFICEKEQSYKDAAESYENAWKYGNKNNPVIGYKLAFNYMKARRFVDAIDICHHVLSSHPNYPKIRKDILEKARASIRI